MFYKFSSSGDFIGVTLLCDGVNVSMWHTGVHIITAPESSHLHLLVYSRL